MKAISRVKPKLKNRNSHSRANSLEEALEVDPVYSRTVKRLKNLLETIPIDDLADEVMSMQATKKVRSLSTSAILASQQTQMIDADTQQAAYRSRAVEIKMRAFRISYSLDTAVKDLKKYIKATYLDELRDMASTISEREEVIQHFLAPLLRGQDELEMLCGLCDIALEDYDAGGYSLHRIGKALELTLPERFK